MSRLVFLSFMLFYFVAKQQAQNLIQNGSFENYTNIDCTYGGFDNGNPPNNHVLDNWYGYQTPDYYNAICNALGWFNAPDNYFGFNQTKNGNAYAGLVVYARGGYDKEYIYQQLSQPLQSGQVYCLSFYVNRADRFTYAIKNIGALFTNSLPSTSNIFEINAIPQVVHTGGFISDTTQWTEIQGCFTANGGEQYITIGNFTSNFNTDTLNTNSTNLVSGREGVSYYYIDDVTLIDQSTVGINELDEENNFEIYPNPTNSILNIKSNNQQLQNATIEIKNSLGQLVYFDVYAHQIKISDLPTGIYFITLNHKETKRTIKFVKD
jgi:hypothetical protein